MCVSSSSQFSIDIKTLAALSIWRTICLPLFEKGMRPTQAA